MKLFNTTPANVKNERWYGAYTNSGLNAWSSTPTDITPYFITLPMHLRLQLEEQGIDILGNNFTVAAELLTNKKGQTFFRINHIKVREEYTLKIPLPVDELAKVGCTATCVLTLSFGSETMSMNIGSNTTVSDLEEFKTNCIIKALENNMDINNIDSVVDKAILNLNGLVLAPSTTVTNVLPFDPDEDWDDDEDEEDFWDDEDEYDEDDEEETYYDDEEEDELEEDELEEELETADNVYN